MKKKAIRLVSLLLALILAGAVFAGCAAENDAETAVTEGNGTDLSESETQSAADATLDRIGNVDYGKADFGILYMEGIGSSTAEIFSEGYATGSEGTTTAVLNDAVFERNTLFAQRCNLNLVLIGKEQGQIQPATQAEIQTHSGEFSLVTNTTSTMASMATSGLLYNYLSMDSVDWDNAWWDRGTLEFALDGKVFFMNGAHNILDDDVTFLTIFNKKMAEEYRIANPYETVRAGDWTVDYFTTLISGISADNGDGVWDERDIYGFTAPRSIGDAFFYGSGLQYIVNSRDMDMPELVLTDNMTKAEDLLTKVRLITLSNNISWIAPHGSESVAMNMFKDGRVMFYIEASSYLGNLNAIMEGIYGALPIPKYDKAQVQYLSYTNAIGSTLGVVADVANQDMIGDLVETFTVLSYKKVKPAYYDNMVTSRNIHDADSAEMLDIVFGNRVYDMATYFTDFGMNEMFSQAALTPSSNFSSKFAAASKRYDRTVKSIMKKFTNMDKRK